MIPADIYQPPLLLKLLYGLSAAVGDKKRPLSKAEASLAASHDQLQMQIVPLLGLLEQARSRAGRQAAHSSLYLLAA